MSDARYCSEACKNVKVHRSFDRCAECGKIWTSQSTEPDKHYRNTAWKICDTCSRDQNRCAVCGSKV